MTACLLALDTSTNQAAIAVSTVAGVVHVARPDPSARHGRALLPAIRDLLAESGLRLEQLDGFVVGIGPGSYTGLRIGLIAAKTFAYTSKKPLATLDSLEIVAQNAPADALAVSVIGDAQRGDLYLAEFDRVAVGAPLQPTRPTRIVSLAEWSASLAPGRFVLGPAVAVERIARVLPEHIRLPDDPSLHRPDPRKLADLAEIAWRTNAKADPWFLEPVYLRRSAAEEQWDARSAP